MTHRFSPAANRRSILKTAAFAVSVLAFPGLRSALAQQGGTGGPLKIGIVGSGHIGGTLGALWVKNGHPVMFSSRHPEELKGLAQSLGPLAHVGTVGEAISFGDAVLIAVPYGAYPEIGRDFAKELAGKVVLDAGNAVVARDGEIANEARTNGIGLTSAKYLTGAHIVRVFNTLNYRVLASESDRPGGRIGIPLAGDDQASLATASALVRGAGFDAVVIGPLVRAKDFAQGAPLYGQQVTALELQRLASTLR